MSSWTGRDNTTHQGVFFRNSDEETLCIEIAQLPHQFIYINFPFLLYYKPLN